MSDLFGVTLEQFRDDLDNTTGSATGNPGSMPIMLVAAANERAASQTVVIRVTLTFWVMFYQRTALATSS